MLMQSQKYSPRNDLPLSTGEATFSKEDVYGNQPSVEEEAGYSRNTIFAVSTLINYDCTELINVTKPTVLYI